MPDKITKRSLYDILGITRRATDEELRDAYRKLSKDHHPDTGTKDAAEYPKIIDAYKALIDPEIRKYYDVTGALPPRDDTLEKESLETVASLMDQVFFDTSAPLEGVDYKASILNLMTGTLAEIQNAIQEATSEIAQLERRRALIVRDLPGELLANVVNDKIGEEFKARAVLEHRMKVMGLAIRKVQTLELQVVPRAPVSAAAGVFFPTGSNRTGPLG